MKITEEEIKRVVAEVLEESMKRFMEGDEDTGDDGGDDAGGDDAGGDDVGGDDSGGDEGGEDGGEGGSEEEPDPEAEITKLSDKVSHGFNAPKNLTLNDGTQTNIAVDSEDQTGGTDQDQENYEVTFEKGNWDTFTQSAQLYSQKVTTIRQTMVPLIEKALIELLETSGAYNRASFESSASFQNGKFRVTAELHYQVDLWIGTDFDPEAIQHDQGYIYQTISAVPDIQIESVKIDTTEGDLQIIASV